MSRIQWELTKEEFIDVCRSKNPNMKMVEILQRWVNYGMFKKTIKDGRTAHEVGASIRMEDLEDEK